MKIRPSRLISDMCDKSISTYFPLPANQSRNAREVSILKSPAESEGLYLNKQYTINHWLTQMDEANKSSLIKRLDDATDSLSVYKPIK